MHDWIDVVRVKEDFQEFLDTFGAPIYRRYFGSASTHPYYGTRTYGTSTVESVIGVWRYVTAEDYRLIEVGRVAVGDVVAVVPSGTTINKTDEWYLKGSTDFYNVTWKQDNIVGSAVVFHEIGLRMGKGRR